MSHRFAKVLEEEIVAINETAFFYPSDLVNTSRLGIISTNIHLPFGE